MANLIYQKMALVMSEIGFIDKAQENRSQGFKFRGIDQFLNALYPILVKHKVFIAPKLISSRSELKEVTRGSGKPGIDKHMAVEMEYAFYAEDGSSVVIGPIPGEGIDSGDKATAKALSGALKYALIQSFSVPTEDMADGDNDSPEIQPTMRKEPVKPMVQPPVPPVPASRFDAHKKGLTRKDLDYVIQWLPQKGRKLSSFTDQMLDSFVKGLYKEAAKDPTVLRPPEEREFVKSAKLYLAAPAVRADETISKEDLLPF